MCCDKTRVMFNQCIADTVQVNLPYIKSNALESKQERH